MIRIIVMGHHNAISRIAVYLGWQNADYDATVRNIGSYLLQKHRRVSR